MGTLYLLPTWLSADAEQSIVPQMLEICEELDHIVTENARTTRRYLRAMGFKRSFDEIEIQELDKHGKTPIKPLLEPLRKGRSIGLFSEAGCPAVADPGSDLVRLAHEMNAKVVPIVSPSSIILALMASGMSGQRFQFHGYLPIDAEKRNRYIVEMEKYSSKYRCTQIFMETPYRNDKLIQQLLKVCKGSTLLCIACDITSKEESITTKTIADWKSKVPSIHKKPAMYCLMAS